MSFTYLEFILYKNILSAYWFNHSAIHMKSWERFDVIFPYMGRLDAKCPNMETCFFIPQHNMIDPHFLQKKMVAL